MGLSKDLKGIATYWLAWLTSAVQDSWGPVDAIAGVAAFAIGFAKAYGYWADQEVAKVTDTIAIGLGWTFAAMLVLRLLTIPYWRHCEDEKSAKGQIAERDIEIGRLKANVASLTNDPDVRLQRIKHQLRNGAEWGVSFWMQIVAENIVNGRERGEQVASIWLNTVAEFLRQNLGDYAAKRFLRCGGDHEPIVPVSPIALLQGQNCPRYLRELADKLTIHDLLPPATGNSPDAKTSDTLDGG